MSTKRLIADNTPGRVYPFYALARNAGITLLDRLDAAGGVSFNRNNSEWHELLHDEAGLAEVPRTYGA